VIAGLLRAVVDGRWYVIGGGAKGRAMTFVSLTDVVEVLTPNSTGVPD
jgi:hypothetical protein